jgi:acetyl-CoA acetyltransferase
MRDVSIIGIGRTESKKGGSFIELGTEAIKKALKDVENLDKEEIEMTYCGRSYNAPLNAGQMMIDGAGMLKNGVFNIENGFTTGITAFRDAYYTVSSGFNDIVLVVGSAAPEEEGSLIIHEGGQGWDFKDVKYPPYTAMFAKLTKRYMKKYGLSKEHLAKISVKNYNNGKMNPHALFKEELTIEDILRSKTIVDPITEKMCVSPASSAVAAILCPSHVADFYNKQPVKIAGFSMTSGKPGLDLLDSSYDPIFRAAMGAYNAIRPRYRVKNIDVAEVYDFYPIREIIAYEALKLCEKGKSGEWIDNGGPMLKGEIPVNTSGGLTANGLSLGGSSLVQLYELVMQLRGKAGDRQVPDAKWAVQECGGSGGSGFCGGIGGIGFGTGGSYFVGVYTNEY